MAWVTLSFSFGSVLTSAKMGQLRDNIAAAFAKDSGAPVLANKYVVNAMVNTDAVKDVNIDKTLSKSSKSFTADEVWMPAAGIYTFVLSAGSARAEIKDTGGTWRGLNASLFYGAFVTDGASYRLIEYSSSTATVYYHKIA